MTSVTRPARVSLLALLALALPAGTAATRVQAEEPVRIYDGGWENIQINSAIAAHVLEVVYGLSTEIVPSNVPDMQKQMIAGTIHINMEMWQSLMAPWVNAQLEEGTIVDLGPTYERATQGFYVPSYVIKGDPARGMKPVAPELRAVDQLAGHAHAFALADGQKPGWINCLEGWACREPNRVKMVTYGVAEAFDPVELGSEAELNQRIRDQYGRGEPFVTYYWDPSPMLGQLDMTMLEEPPYTEECRAAIEAAVQNWKPGNGASQACAYETVPITKFATSGFVETHPEVAETLKLMNVGTDTVRELAGYMVSEEASPKETAIHFFRTYPEVWRKWMNDDQAEAITAGLRM